MKKIQRILNKRTIGLLLFGILLAGLLAGSLPALRGHAEPEDSPPKTEEELWHELLKRNNTSNLQDSSKPDSNTVSNAKPVTVGPGKSDLDYILNYIITVDVNEQDATLHMVYHIDWKVLNDSKEGPLTWVAIGIPNTHCRNEKALSDTIKSIKYVGSYQQQEGSFLKIVLDRSYYKDEVVSFDFEFDQDYMYQMNKEKKGETVYSFIPGWFDEIVVQNMQIRWNANQVRTVSPAPGSEYDCRLTDGYYVWTSPLTKGQKYGVDVKYPNDAFNFNSGKVTEQVVPKRKEADVGVIVIWTTVIAIFFTLVLPYLIMFVQWKTGSGFAGYEPAKVYTIIEYHTGCPTCGAPREAGSDQCRYCETSFIKSERKVEEKKLPKDLKNYTSEIFSHNQNGTYAATFHPYTFIRVSSGLRPKPVSFGEYVKKANESGRRGGGGSCAHSSCACACACACAGGGRAGCTAKDFYKTNLKLSYFEKGNAKESAKETRKKT